MGKFRHSWALTKKSWSVVAADKKLLALPMASAVCGLLITAIFLVPTTLLTFGTDVSAATTAASDQNVPVVVYPVLFVMYVALAFSATFFNAALIKIADVRLSGGEASVGDGLRFAASKAAPLFGWAVLNATVGMALRMLADRAGALGAIVIRLVGVAWALVTYFVVPVLVFEGIGPFSAVKRSASIFRARWGEQFIGAGGIGLVAGFAVLGGMLVGMLGGVLVASGSAAIGVPLLVLAVLWVVVVALVASALQQIYNVALYRFAVSPAGDAASVGAAAPANEGPFNAQELAATFVPKPSKRR